MVRKQSILNWDKVTTLLFIEMKRLTILFLAIFSITSCCKSKEPFPCNCNSKYFSYNDSVVNKLVTDTTFFNYVISTYNVPKVTLYKTETYRLKMFHSFSRYTQIYTLSRKKTGAKLEVIQYFHDDTSGKIKFDKKYDVLLTEDQWLLLKHEIDTSCYWSNKIGSGHPTVLDGGSWLLEGFDPAQRNCPDRMYHIDFCSFGRKNKLGDLCRSIRKYAKEEKLDVYSH